MLVKALFIANQQQFKGRLQPQLNVDMTTPYSDNFLVSGNKITKVEPAIEYSLLVINEDVPKQGKYTCKWKISTFVYENGCSCFLGLMPKEFKNYRVSHFSKSVFSFFGHRSKSRLSQGNEQGVPLMHGYTIQITLDNEKNTITFKIMDGQIVKGNHYFENKQLNGSLNLVPFVQLLQPTDCLEWIGSAKW